MSNEITVHNPLGFAPKVAPQALAPRLDGLAGKTVYLVDCRFDNAGPFMEQMADWFAEQMPEVTTRIARWRDALEDDPELAAEIGREGDAAILGVGL